MKKIIIIGVSLLLIALVAVLLINKSRSEGNLNHIEPKIPTAAKVQPYTYSDLFPVDDLLNRPFKFKERKKSFDRTYKITAAKDSTGSYNYLGLNVFFENECFVRYEVAKSKQNGATDRFRTGRDICLDQNTKDVIIRYGEPTITEKSRLIYYVDTQENDEGNYNLFSESEYLKLNDDKKKTLYFIAFDFNEENGDLLSFSAGLQ